MHKKMKPVFKDILKGKVVIVGIGNIMRRDDGFGPVLVDRIKNRVKALCINAGTAPENYTKDIIKERPDTILLVDALHMEKRPGDYEILKKEDILRSGFTTHDISPVMLIEYLEKETGADIYMLGVQPQHVLFGEELSPRVKRTLDEISRALGRFSNA